MSQCIKDVHETFNKIFKIIIIHCLRKCLATTPEMQRNIEYYISILFPLANSLAGMSRSVTIAVAYIMSITSLRWNEALKVVRGARAVSNPNSGFQKQLQDFESSKLPEVSNYPDTPKFHYCGVYV